MKLWRMMKYHAKQPILLAGVVTLTCGLLLPSGLLRQGAPDIVWSRGDHTKAVHSVTFSRDASLVTSGSSDGTIRIWGITTGSPIITLSNQTVGVLQISFRSDGTLSSWDL